MVKTSYVKKLSVKTMNAIPANLKELENGARVAVAHFIGRADGVETGTTAFGDWKALTGVFKGVNLETGEIFRGAKCFMPDIAVEEIAARLAELEGNDSAIEFAVEIGIQRDIKLDAKGNEIGAGYSYTMSPLIEPDEAQDPLMAIESRILGAQGALEYKATEKPVKTGKSK